MEKYRRFDDATCGVNPFIPLPETPRTGILKIARLVRLYPILFLSQLLGVFLLFVKGSFLSLLVSLLLFFNLIKYLLIIPPLIRLLERVTNIILCKLMLSSFAVNTMYMTYHPEHKGYNFM